MYLVMRSGSSTWTSPTDRCLRRRQSRRPDGRAILAQLVQGRRSGRRCFPYHGRAHGHVAAFPARFLRVGFVGELGYEIHVPASCGEFLWDRLTEAGAPLGIKPFGVEAQRILRLEKGHIIVGQDTDGLTTPFEANLAWAVPKSKSQYRGKSALETRKARGSDRLIVGFRLGETDSPPPENCLVIDGPAIVGRATSAAWSKACGGVIGLAFLPPERSAPGSRFAIRLPTGEMVAGEVSSTPFYDPAGARQEL